MVGDGLQGVDVACSVCCSLGEGPLWDHRTQRLHWVDIRGRAVFTLDPASGISTRVPTPEEVGFVGLTPDPGVLVAGLKSGLSKLSLATGGIEKIVSIEAEKPTNRINDGTVAPDGAVLFGTLDMEHAGATGTYWRYHRGQLCHLGGTMVVTNGPGLSADGTVALTVDTIGMKIHRNHYRDGAFEPVGLFATYLPGQGLPDGVTFDAEGHVWVGHYGGGRLTRFKPDGSVDRVIHLPANQVTKCAFGGADLRTLYITTAAHRRPLADEPLAGALFSLTVDTPGIQACVADL